MFSFVCFVQVKRLARKIVSKMTYYVLSPTQLNHASILSCPMFSWDPKGLPWMSLGDVGEIFMIH